MPELPAGESQVEGTTSFLEMAGSFPPAELDSLNVQTTASHHVSNMANPYTAPEHLQNYYKANQNATLRRAAPISMGGLAQLPRLQVPQSQHSVPRLISDHSPLTPSPISPITPILCGHNRTSWQVEAVSPCTAPDKDQIFACYGSWGNGPSLSPSTPSTCNSFGSSQATTPLSAYPSSAHSSFHNWPQPQRQLQPPTYPQNFLHPNYMPHVDNSMFTEGSSWQNNVQSHPYDFNDSFPTYAQPCNVSSIPQLPDSFAHGQSCFEKQNHISTTAAQPLLSPPQLIFDDAPPAYSPVVPDEQPTPITNPKRRYPPSVCPHCGTVFTGKYGPGNCKRHVQQVHETFFDKALHMCKLCMKTYNRKDALRKHQWKKHRLENARPHKRRERGI